MSADLSRIYQVLDQVAAMTAVPRHLREEIERELLPALFARLQQDNERAAAACAFCPGGQPGTWLVGDPDMPRLVPGGRAHAALVAAWRAISGELPHCSDLAGGDDPVRGVRRMVRKTAPAWAARHCPPLAAAFGRILILDGRLQYSAGGAVRVRSESVSVLGGPSAATISSSSLRNRP